MKIEPLYLETIEYLENLKKDSDESLDKLYDIFDHFLKNGNLIAIEDIILNVNEKKLSLNILIGLLVTTLPVRSKLVNRPGFVKRVEAELKARSTWEDGLLQGLE